jgi:hypothetical protein
MNDWMRALAAQYGWFRHRHPTDDRLSFNGRIESLGESGVRTIAATHPGAIVQCPIDFLGPLVLAMPEATRDLLRELERWGVTRLSLSWRTESVRCSVRWVT